MGHNQSKNRNESTSDKIREIDERRKRAITKAVGASVLAWIIAFAIYAILKSVHDRSTFLDIILLLWNAVIIAAPFVGVWVYRKNK
jgi:hypothetical protein